MALLSMLHGSGAVAQRTYDAKQLAMLPPYCKYTQIYRQSVPGGNDPEQLERWTSVMGPQNFIHLHHYCWGLEDTNQGLYFASTKADKDRALAEAVREFDYVVERVSPDFALLPEILTRRGENRLRLGNGPQGLQDLTRAIELKADHWPPYAALSDYYKTLGDRRSAREWLEKGLAAAPGTRALERRRAALDETKSGRAPSTN